MRDILSMNLEARRKYLEGIIKQKTASLRNVPEGKLRCSARTGRKNDEYYLVSEANRVNGKYISSKNHDMVKALAQKEYDSSVLTAAEQEYRLICRLEKKRESGTVEDIYERYSNSRKKLIKPLRLPDQDFIAQWESIDYPKQGFSDGDPEFFTDKGERVRSKTEVIIANTLNKLNIPYRYEFPLLLNGWGRVYPDFTILNVRLRKEIVWEHYGKMDSADYARKNLAKLDAYIKNGYYQGVNLILTMESSQHSISTRQIELLANKFLK